MTSNRGNWIFPKGIVEPGDTPESAALKKSVTGGARGGGGSNFTGSWSGTASLCPPCAF